MSKLDHVYEEVIKDLLTNGVSDEGTDVRGKYADGTPAYTKSKFGIQLEYDTSEVPTLTTKRVPHITAGKEMLLFWVKQTVKEEDFIEANCHVWREWFNEKGNLGRSYAYQFESHRHHERDIVKVKPIIKEHHGELKKVVVGYSQSHNALSSDELTGKSFLSNSSGKFKVLDVYNGGEEYNGQIVAKVQFEETGNVSVFYKSNVISGSIKDVYARCFYGVGYLGDYKSVKNYTDEEVEYLKGIWRGIIRRCYDNKHRSYNIYGKKGIFVDERWHSFENFLREVRYIPQFFLAKEKKFKGYQLDKDYFLSNCYSSDTCVWIHKTENTLYGHAKPILIGYFNGDEKIVLGVTELSKALEVSRGTAHKWASGTSHTYKNAGIDRISYIDDSEHLYRYELSRNQVVELLKDIKNNPSSRRLLTSFWNFADVKKKVLQECAFQTQWKVRQGYLDLILEQRSCDIGLGYVFNVYQYYLLLRLIAHVSGLKVGAFKHQLGDYHIYDRHEDILIEQVEREKHPAPTLEINENIVDFFDFTISDIKVIDYKSSGESPMEVAI